MRGPGWEFLQLPSSRVPACEMGLTVRAKGSSSTKSVRGGLSSGMASECDDVLTPFEGSWMRMFHQ